MEAKHLLEGCMQKKDKLEAMYFSHIDKIMQLVDSPDSWVADTFQACLCNQYLDALAVLECKEDSVEKFSYTKMKNILQKYGRNHTAPHCM